MSSSKLIVLLVLLALLSSLVESGGKNRDRLRQVLRQPRPASDGGFVTSEVTFPTVENVGNRIVRSKMMRVGAEFSSELPSNVAAEGTSITHSYVSFSSFYTNSSYSHD